MGITEYRGCSGLVYAEVTQDDAAGYAAGTVKPLAGLAEISKKVKTDSATKYYDNLAAIVINAKGADEVSFTVSKIPLPVLAEITGQHYDDALGALSEGADGEPKYFAVGYKLDDTDGDHHYVWRYKGTFAVPDVEAKTRDDGTDASGQTVTYTGVNTMHEFAKGGSSKALVVDTEAGLADLGGFFDSVTTIDTLQAKAGA
jgi:phi13 family phage major tail protein